MKNNLKTPRNLAFLGLMLAITIILDVTPLGAIPLGAISATITHIPTIITGILLGPAAGLIMGTSFGIITLIHALTRPVTVLDPLFINPLISVLPRMFVGIVAYYVYAGTAEFFKRFATKQSISVFVGAVCGSLTNTILVFFMLYLIYAREIVAQLGAPFSVIFLGVFTTNAIAEAVLSGVIVLPVALQYLRYNRGRKI